MPVYLRVAYIHANCNNNGPVAENSQRLIEFAPFIDFKDFSKKIIEELNIPTNLPNYPIEKLHYRLKFKVNHHIDLTKHNFYENFVKFIQNDKYEDTLVCYVGWRPLSPRIQAIKQRDESSAIFQVYFDPNNVFEREFSYEIATVSGNRKTKQTVRKSDNAGMEWNWFSVNISTYNYKDPPCFRVGCTNILCDEIHWSAKYQFFLIAPDARDAAKTTSKNTKEYIAPPSHVNILLLGPPCRPNENYYYSTKSVARNFEGTFVFFIYLFVFFYVFSFASVSSL